MPYGIMNYVPGYGLLPNGIKTPEPMLIYGQL